MSFTLNPLGSRLLVKLRAQPQKGLILRVTNDDAARAGDVIAIGPEVRDLEVGQGVLVSSLAGQQVGDDVLLPESSVLAYLDD